MEERIRHRLVVPVTNPILDRFSFILVAAFGRCKFHLTAMSVGHLLQAALGGSAPCFFVSQLSDRMFKFVVSSKKVGRFIASLQFFSYDAFKVYFFLWGNGGPNWRREFSMFLREEDSWSQQKQPQRSYVDALNIHRTASSSSNPMPPNVVSIQSGANVVPLGKGKQVIHAYDPDPRNHGTDMAGHGHNLAAPEQRVTDGFFQISHGQPSCLSRANSTPLGGGHAKSYMQRNIPKPPVAPHTFVHTDRGQTRHCTCCLSHLH